MGYSTDYVGCVVIDPPLNHAEQQYLTAFCASRRFDRVDGPYAVPGNPAAEGDPPPALVDRYNRVTPGQPAFYSGWIPDFDGARLRYDGVEKFNTGTAWMVYLIDHFLRPGAVASTSGSPLFAEFSFDHVLDGMIAGSRQDTELLFVISVVDNEVTESALWAPGSERAGITGGSGWGCVARPPRVVRHLGPAVPPHAGSATVREVGGTSAATSSATH